MSGEWIGLASGIVGAVLGAGGAVATTLITTRSDRTARAADRKEDRKDRAAELQQNRTARRADQGRAAAREALAITSQFFTNTVERPGPNRGDSFIGFSGWDEIRRIDDHAELIDSETIRAAVRAIIEAIGTAEYVTMLGRDYLDPDQWDSTKRRERKLLLLLRRTLGAYLRDEDEQYETLLAEARREEAAGEEARLQVERG